MRHLPFFPLLVVLVVPIAILWHLMPPLSAPRLIGHVRDAAGPVPGALVRFKGEPNAVRTDRDGRFALPQRPGRVTASKAGYFIAGAPADQTPLILTLHPLPTQDCEAYAWVDPAPDRKGRHNCGNCHGDIYREW